MSHRTIHFVSLGCPKNRVDSEVMLGAARGEGYVHVDDPASAEVIVVNTCGFIDAAKQESIDTILDLSEHKESGSCRKLIVTGCLSQRYPQDLADGLPEVDHFLGSSDMLKIRGILDRDAERILVGNPADWVIEASDPRTLSTRGASAYVKIAEGCNRQCSFCVIPHLRGKQRSRTIDDVVTEVRSLVDAGVVEVNLVSQDTIAYGRERRDGTELTKLVRQVADVPGLRWLRVHYLYPEKIDDGLIDLFADHPVVLPYIDMPLQHAADAMLRRMRRGHGGQRLRDLVERLRSRIPELTFRSAFIVGHPGETDSEFRELCDFVKWAELDRVGVFRYSDEEEAHAHGLEAKVPSELAAERAEELMELQRGISRQKNDALIGRELDVLVEGPSEESELVFVGRHRGQAPDIDGCVFLSGGEVSPGQMVIVEVTQATDYDLLGEVDEDTIIPAPRQGDSAQTLLHRASDGRRVLRTLA